MRIGRYPGLGNWLLCSVGDHPLHAYDACFLGALCGVQLVAAFRAGQVLGDFAPFANHYTNGLGMAPLRWVALVEVGAERAATLVVASSASARGVGASAAVATARAGLAAPSSCCSCLCLP